MTRPEFKIKMDLAGVFGFFKGFGPTVSVWKLTAAQRAILLGPDQPATKTAPTKKLSLDELRALTERNKATLGLARVDDVAA
jgi:hypothetical protein